MTERRPTERHTPEKHMSESAHQRAIFKWTQQPHIRQKWPDLKLLFHVKNETTEGARQVAVDRAMGTRKGVPDLCLPVARRGYHGMWVELKNETGRPSKEQKWWIEELGKQAVCQGYANLLNLMLHTQGIPVINSNGYMNNNGSFFGHAWNYVYFSNQWWLSDPTNSMEFKAAELSKYQGTFIPLFADGNFLETEQFSYNYAYEKLNLNVVNFADEAFVVPFSVTLTNGEKYQINTFNPTTDLPSNVKEIYIGKNIISLGQDGIYGLKEHAPSVENAYVDPKNTTLLSYEGVVYEAYNDAPLYIPTAKKVVYLKPTFNGVIGKNFLYKENNVEEVYIPEGTTSMENWAVEKCPNLKVAYLPLNTEYNEKTTFVDVHPDFKVVRMDMTGIKDVIAD